MLTKRQKEVIEKNAERERQGKPPLKKPGKKKLPYEHPKGLYHGR